MVNLYADLSPRLYSALQKVVHGDHGATGRALLKAYHPYRPGRVLELGCGTGILSKFFQPGEYVGCDLDSERIESAKVTYPGHEFIAADATQLQPEFVASFTFVFCHAWVHHIDDDPVRRILDRIALGSRQATRPIGMLILEPILPERPFLNPFGYLLAKLDRGRFVRGDQAMRSLFGTSLSDSYQIHGRWYWPIPGGAYRLEFGVPVHGAALEAGGVKV